MIARFPKSSESGFTLLEMIVSLTILGIIVAIAGMGIVIGTRGYIMTRENTNMAQKAQLALSRLTREMLEITAIRAENFSNPTGEVTYLIYENLQGTHAVSREGTHIKMYELNTGDMTVTGEGDPLIDEIVDDDSGFTIQFYKGTDLWSTVDPFSELTRIDIAFILRREDSGVGDKTFSMSVFPRNQK